MIDHMGIPVTDHAKAHEFYLAALAPLDIAVVMEVTAEQTGDKAHTGFGNNGKPFFWISECEKGMSLPGLHVAFTAATRDLVDAFYHAALAAGGRDNGAPGLRPHYHENYYGAFILDLDGNNIEAVCHSPVA